MNDSKMGRREAARRALTVLGASVVAPAVLLGCGGQDEGGGELSCMDTAGLDAAGVASRESQAYADTSSTPEETCVRCRFYTAGQAGRCGTCQVVQGPIHPEGTCNLWAATS